MFVQNSFDSGKKTHNVFYMYFTALITVRTCEQKSNRNNSEGAQNDN